MRRAVAPDYEVERELASGGMGTVFLGRDVALERPVAIKVLRPELGTATLTERFLREARILASLNHPNVVAVHRAGEGQGLSWYVMDYLAAETLADRLARGPLTVAGAVGAALGVLSALEAAHRNGIVHRDVKPANVFLTEGRAVLSDFGIASSATSGGEPLTIPGEALGTPDYMAPEQMIGKPTSPATDLCCVGLLLYESLTGKRFEAWENPDRADWSRVPHRLVPVVRRALALDPAARWPDAASFALAIRRARQRPGAQRVLWWVAGLSLAAAAVVVLGKIWPPRPGGEVRVVIRPFHVTGVGAPAWLDDSLAQALARSLLGNPDFQVRAASSTGDTAGTLILDGHATVRGDSLELTVSDVRADARSSPFHADTSGTLAGWDQAATDLGYQVLLGIWSRRNAAVAEDLPVQAAPRTSEGLRAFLDAELLFATAQWGAAYRAYKRAHEIDSTCVICDVRRVDVGRWLGREPDSALARRYRAAADVLPPRYRDLLRATFAPSAERLQDLHDLTERYHDWAYGWFILGDEIFHRGGFIGVRRAETLFPFQKATVLRPDFAPAWEHLAWAAIAEGDSAEAARALERYDALAPMRDTAAQAIGALIHGGFEWRFLPEAHAVAYTTLMLRAPGIAAYGELSAAASYLLTFEAPRGTVWLGERFAQGDPRRDLEQTGRLAQVYGLVALGQVDSALALVRLAGAGMADTPVALFAAELPAALALADSADVAARYAALAAPLEPFVQTTHKTPLARARAAWMLGMLALRARRPDAADRYLRILADEERKAAPMERFLRVLRDPAARGAFGTALGRSAALVALDSADRGGDPFYRALLHLARADWQLAEEKPELAVAELRWHEAQDFAGYPGLSPQAGDVDCALATLARWDRARLLKGLGPGFRDEECDNLGLVARAWKDGEPRYRVRADSARSRFVALRCGGAR